jgi:beta-1,4-N-acetylglucosaminyltransferase
MALEWMASQGYSSLIIQYGTGRKPTIPEQPSTSEKIAYPKVHSYSFQPSLDKDMRQADLIISHAGAGTVMEALRLQKTLVVVINTSLMDNHQTELASAMAERGHLFVVDEPKKLNQFDTWRSFESFLPVAHKGGDEFDFPILLDAHLGFTNTYSTKAE